MNKKSRETHIFKNLSNNFHSASETTLMSWVISYCSYLNVQRKLKISCMLPADGISEKLNKQHMRQFIKSQSLQDYS